MVDASRSGVSGFACRMAKWGEGDARWIVEEREDSTNVNNWHWTEKNATKWSKERLSTLLVDLSFDDKSGACVLCGPTLGSCRCFMCRHRVLAWLRVAESEFNSQVGGKRGDDMA